mmetsp:Transcript_40945/g.98746  ORF Transcript_40945/g.98746 Transcript_40945/m.98746 type:complete len:363 (+) Transcript_40945:407-1495(+)
MGQPRRSTTKSHHPTRHQWPPRTQHEGPIQTTLPPILDEIRHEWLDLEPITIPNIFAHLLRQPSGHVTAEDVEDRRKQIEKQAYSLAEELTTYFKRLTDYQLYAQRGGEEVTDTNLINTALRHIRATGHFNRACEDWDNRPAANRTWPQLKTFFQRARIVAQRNASANATANYQAANQLIAQQDTRFASMQEENKRNQEESQRALQQLSEQMNMMLQGPPPPAGPPPFPPPFAGIPFGPSFGPPPGPPPMAYSLNHLPPPYNYMYHAPAAPPNQDENLQRQIEELKRQLDNKENNGGKNRNDRNKPRTQRQYHNDNYCWTHGYDVGKTHNSATCRRPRPGHQATATKQNPMGGSTKHKNLVE